MAEIASNSANPAAFDEDAQLDIVSELLTFAMLASLFRRDGGAQGAVARSNPAKPAPAACVLVTA